jgi:hypothetical protein
MLYMVNVQLLGYKDRQIESLHSAHGHFILCFDGLYTKNCKFESSNIRETSMYMIKLQISDCEDAWDVDFHTTLAIFHVSKTYGGVELKDFCAICRLCGEATLLRHLSNVLIKDA